MLDLFKICVIPKSCQSDVNNHIIFIFYAKREKRLRNFRCPKERLLLSAF